MLQLFLHLVEKMIKQRETQSEEHILRLKKVRAN